MKKIIQKTAATIFAVTGIFSAMPAVFCTQETINSNSKEFQNNTRGHIDIFHAMIVGKYFDSTDDFKNLEMTNKKYEGISERYKYYPVECDTPNIFPNAKTYYVRNENFIYTFPNENIKTIVYHVGSFDSNKFWQVLIRNLVNDVQWKQELKLNDPTNSAYGFDITYTSLIDGRKIVFKFNPSLDGIRFNSPADYNTFLFNCGISDERTTISLDRIIIPEGISEISEDAFKNCNFLTHVKIPNSVKKIGSLAFYNCFSLKNITLPNSLKKIEFGAFKGCHNLQSVTIPNSVEKIEMHAFGSCSSLVKIVIPDSVKIIENFAFGQCRSLKSVTIPTSIKKIGNETFWLCNSLEEIKFNGKVYNSMESFLQAFNAYQNNK